MSNSQPAPDAAPLALTWDELTRPTEQQIARLLDLCKRIYKAKPWQKLEEEDIFVVKNPCDGALLFVGTIGGAGEQTGVVIYRGAQAYYGLLDFLERAHQLPPMPQAAAGLEGADELMAMLSQALSEANFNPMELMQLPQLQLMFEPRAALEDEDKEWIKRHKYTATGAGFPTFRSIVSSYLPWWISQSEAEAMIVALEQLLQVVASADWEDLIEIRDIDRGESFVVELLARVPERSASGELTWSNQRMVIEPPDFFAAPAVTLDREPVARIKALPASRETLEVALLGTPTPLGDAHNRPFFPTVLLLGHGKQVVANELLQAGYGDALAPLIARELLRLLAQRPKRPAKLQFSSPDLNVLNPIGAALGIEIEEVEALETLDPALEALVEQMESFDPDSLSDEEWAQLEAQGLPRFPG